MHSCALNLPSTDADRHHSPPARATCTPARPSPPRLGLLEALAAPHGVDRYLELIRPSWSLHEARAEVVAVRRADRRQRHPDPAPERAWEGFRAGQFVQLTVEIDGVRHTRCYSPACSDGTRPRRSRSPSRRHPEGLVSNFLDRARAPGHGRRPLAGRRRLPASRRAARRAAADQRRQRHHPGDVDAAHALRRGHTGAVDLPPLRARPASDVDLPRRARASSPPRIRTCASSAPTRAPGAGELDGHFSRAHLRAGRAPLRRGRDLRLRPARPARRRSRRIWAEDGLEHRLHVESFVPPASRSPSGERRGQRALRAARDVEVRTAARPCSSRPSRPGSAPSPAAGWASATPAPAARRRAASEPLTGEVSISDDEEIQICVSAPLGDVVVDL